MEEGKQKIVLIGVAGELGVMAASAARFASAMDALCIKHLEVKAMKMTCPDIDLPRVTVDCCGPWSYDGFMSYDDVVDAKAMAAALMPMVPPTPPVEMVARERLVGASKPYRGYMNSRHGRRRNW